MVIFLLEISEFVRALGFAGSDILFLISFALLLIYAKNRRLSALHWAFLIYIFSVPVIYSVTAGRHESAIMAFSILTFFLAIAKQEERRRRLARGGWFLFLLTISYFGSVGDPVYERSNFNSLFFSGNAFIYYVLINGCIIAYCSRGLVIPALASTPFLLMQTKSVISLCLSNRRFLAASLLLAAPAVVFFGLAYLDRIVWFFNQYGIVYALGAGRVERFKQVASSEFSWSVALIGSPLSKDGENFEVEFIDIARDFGIPYALLLYAACFLLIRKYGDVRLILLFILLNLSGHFWNNPLVIIVFVGLTYYANSYRNQHVSR